MTTTLHHSHLEIKGPKVGLVQVLVTKPSLCFKTRETSQDLFHCP